MGVEAGRVILDSLAFEHLFLYRERQVLPLADQGLVMVQGDNRVSASMSSNGVGKTSITHALAFAWYGRTLDGRRGDEVACRFTQAPGLAVARMRDAQGAWSVLRGVRPKRLELTGFAGLTGEEDDAVLQAKVEARLGLGFRTFRTAVVFVQGAFERFVDADQAEKMRMLDEIQGLDLRAALDAAKAWRDVLEAEVGEHGAALAKLDEQEAEARRQLEALEEAEASFARVKAEQVAAAARAATAAEAALSAARAAVDQHGQLRRAAEDLRRAWDVAEAAGVVLDRAAELWQRALDEAEAAEEALAALDRSLDALVARGACPSCRADVKSHDARARLKAAFAADRQGLEARVREARQRAEAAQAEVDRQAPKVDAARRRLPEGCDAARVAAAEAASSPASAAALDREASARRDEAKHRAQELRAAKERRWEGAEARRGLQKTLDEVQRARADLPAALDKRRRLLDLARYWVEAFGDRGVRSLVFDAVAPYLSERVAAHLEVLTAGEGRLDIAATRALKKGGVREALTFRPEWAWGGSGVGSAGQDRRIDLALFAALQDLAEFQSAQAFPLKVWDEPGDALDGLGKDIFLGWLGQQARARGTGLFVTHSQELASSAVPDQVWTVVLDRDGARVEGVACPAAAKDERTTPRRRGAS